MIPCIIYLFAIWLVPYILRLDLVSYIFMVLLITGFILLTVLVLKNLLFHSYVVNEFFGTLAGLIHCNINVLIDNSDISSEYLALLMFIGIAMLTIDIIFNDNHLKTSIIDRLVYVWKNKKLFFIIVLFIFIISIVINLLGIGVIIDTNNITLFILTVFCKVVLLKIVFIIFIFTITKKLQISNFYFDLESIIAILFLSYINIYYIIPFIGLSFIQSCTFIGQAVNSIKPINASELVKGIILITKTLPVVGRIINLFELANNNVNSKYVNSPFKVPYTSFCIHNKINYLLSYKVYIPVKMRIVTPIIHQFTSIITCNNSYKEFFQKMYINSSIIRDTLINLSNKHLNLHCKIRLVCTDSIKEVHANISDGSFKKLTVYNSPIKEYDSKFNIIPNNYVDIKNLTNKQFDNSLIDKHHMVDNSLRNIHVFSLHSIEENDTDILMEETSLPADDVDINQEIDESSALATNSDFLETNNNTHNEEDLVDITEQLWEYFVNRYRRIENIRNNDIFQIADLEDEELNILPDNLQHIWQLRLSPYDSTSSLNNVHSIDHELLWDLFLDCTKCYDNVPEDTFDTSVFPNFFETWYFFGGAEMIDANREEDLDLSSSIEDLAKAVKEYFEQEQ